MSVSIHRKIALGLFGLLFAAAAAADIAAQATFSDESVEYSFEIPDDRWKMTVKPTASNPNVEYVFVDRLDGHLEVRKVSIPRGSLMSDLIRDEETKLRFLRGFVAGKEENFGGKLSGSIYNFEYVRAGRPMSGRFYFLRSGESVYILRFTGFRDKLKSIWNQTDIIARTFGVKA